ncbi:MAG TPA: Ig-like domain-containing protein [Bryobacteraceae bacterium]|nr:Ig-like domain-containing protein [Bryobacteraceae bacterium]
MVHSYGSVSRGGLVSWTLSVLFLAAAVLHAESQLQIDSPKNGLVVKAGDDLIITVKTLDVAFQSISLVGEGPFALSTGISAPPYRFSYPIAADVPSGRYQFKAAGVTGPGTTVYSDPVEVDIEQADKPKNLQSECQSLSMIEHENAALVIWGIFADGSKVNLTRSAQITYSSDKPSVAAVSNEGGVSAAAAGKARIAVKYADKTILVPVVITHR